MKDRLIGLQQAKDVEKEWYERQLQQLGTEYKETKDQLISENIIIGMSKLQASFIHLKSLYGIPSRILLWGTPSKAMVIKAGFEELVQ